MAGKLEVLFELNIADARSQGAVAGRNFAQGFADAFKGATASFKLLNPGLFGPQKGTITPPTEAPGLRGILKSLALGPLIPPNVFQGLKESTGKDLAKVFSMGPLIPPNTIQGLKDVTGKELGKMFAMGPLIPPGVIRGLKEQTGKDLAKVLSLPDITSFDKQPTNWKQGILGGLLGLRHPFIGARMMNESGMFGGGGGKGGGMSGFFGGGSGGFEKAFIALEGLKIAAEGVKIAFDVLKKSFEEGFKLFTESSRLGIKSGELFNREFAAKAIGVSVADIEKYMLRQQWGKARTSLQNFGAGSSIRNMNEMFQDMIQSGERLVPVMTRISGEFYRVGFAGIKLEREWDALVALIGEQLTSATEDFLTQMQTLLQIFNDSGQATELGQALSVALAVIEKLVDAFGILIETSSLVMNVLFYDIPRAFMVCVQNMIAAIPGSGVESIGVVDFFKQDKAKAEGIAKMAKQFFSTTGFGAADGVGQGGTPSSGGYKAPQTSTWEKIGYVIGGHQQSPVEKQLILSNQWLAKIHQALKPRKNDTLVNPPGSQGLRVNPA